MFVFVGVENKLSEKRNVVRTFAFEVAVSTALLPYHIFTAEWLLYISPALNVEISLVFLLQ
jgi:hypothetical protein